jgi:hypothetical protein
MRRNEQTHQVKEELFGGFFVAEKGIPVDYEEFTFIRMRETTL